MYTLIEATYYLKDHQTCIISIVDIDISTINGGEIANKKGFLKLNMHISLEGYPDFALNPRSSISQGAIFRVYWVVTRINNFVMNEVITNIICHLPCILLTEHLARCERCFLHS